jgi:hypothetical protein
MADQMTYWTCERCGASGWVRHSRRADVWSVAQAILDNHLRVAPECLGGRNGVRCELPVEHEPAPADTPPEGET